MNKNPYVLKALKILGLEEMLKLAEILKTKQLVMKKAAGEDLVVWTEPAQGVTEAKILPFQSKTLVNPERAEPGAEESLDVKDEDQTHFTSSETMLWQIKLTKDSEASLQKQEAFNGYKKSAEMYVVKSDLPGKDKLKVASTNGVLVNKKQA